MYQFEKMNKKLLGSQVEDELMNYILQEHMGVGKKIPNEHDLGEKFGVGRSTVREAVKALVSKGVLEVRRGDGTYVINTSPIQNDPLGLSRYEDKYKLAIELLEVRLMIEPEIAALAALYATEQEKIRIRELCHEVEQLYQSGVNHLKRDVEFHEYIAGCSRNRVVETLIPIVNTAVITFGNLTQRKLMEETIKTHRMIAESIGVGDSVGARCAMVMHLTYNREYLVREKEKHQTFKD